MTTSGWRLELTDESQPEPPNLLGMTTWGNPIIRLKLFLDDNEVMSCLLKPDPDGLQITMRPGLERFAEALERLQKYDELAKNCLAQDGRWVKHRIRDIHQGRDLARDEEGEEL